MTEPAQDTSPRLAPQSSPSRHLLKMIIDALLLPEPAATPQDQAAYLTLMNRRGDPGPARLPPRPDGAWRRRHLCSPPVTCTTRFPACRPVPTSTPEPATPEPVAPTAPSLAT